MSFFRAQVSRSGSHARGNGFPHELDTVEPAAHQATAGTQGVTSTDNSASHDEFTQGDRYRDYGNLYLRILRELGSDGAGVLENSLRCTVDTCMVTGGIDSCWCSEYASCDCV